MQAAHDFPHAPHAGLDPTWELTHEFPISDENTAKCSASFFMGEGEEMKQIGDTQTYLVGGREGGREGLHYVFMSDEAYRGPCMKWGPDLHLTHVLLVSPHRCHFAQLNVLIVNKPTFKAIIVPGGQVQMMFTAKGFGKEDAPVEDDGLLDLLDGGEMCMDD